MSMMFHIVRSGGRFEVRDGDGVLYGTYNNESEAEEARDGWKKYYESPLL